MNSISFSKLTNIWKISAAFNYNIESQLFALFPFPEETEGFSNKNVMEMKHILHFLIGIFHLD